MVTIDSIRVYYGRVCVCVFFFLPLANICRVYYTKNMTVSLCAAYKMV